MLLRLLRGLLHGEPHGAASRPGHTDVQAALSLATALCRQGRLWEAAAPARAAWLAEPADVSCRECLRYVALNVMPEDREGSSAWPDERQRELMSLVARGNAERQAGELDAAEASYRRALSIDPGDPFVHNRIGALLCCAARYDESAPHFAASARAGLQPDDVIDLSRGFLSRLGESSPSAPEPRVRTDGTLTFLASCDPVYFRRFAWPLARSVAANAHLECRLRFHIVNPDAGLADEAARLREALPDLRVEVTEERIDPAAMANPRTYYACARFLQLPGLLRERGGAVAIIDMDTLVLRDLAPLMARLRDADLALARVDRGLREPGEILWAAFTWFGGGAASLRAGELVAAYIRHFLSTGRPTWFLDQIALLAAHAACRQGLLDSRIHLLDDTLLSSADSAAEAGDAFFWSIAASVAQHARRVEDPAFVAYARPPA